MGQRTLFNFDVKDPFDSPTVDGFKQAFKKLHGRFPRGNELNEYYVRHPQEWERKHGEPLEGSKKRLDKRKS